MIELKDGERLDDLGNGMRIIQSRDKFAFSTDAVALADFVNLYKGDRVMDLGAGTGAVSLLMVGRKPLASVTGLELQPQLVDMAQRSAALNDLTHVHFQEGDLRQVQKLFPPGSYDVVVSNPPYQPVGGLLQNQRTAFALARHELACTLEDIVSACAWLVRFRGKVALVHRPERLVDILSLMRKAQLEPKRLQFVFPKPGAVPVIVLVEAQKGARPGLLVMAPKILGGV